MADHGSVRTALVEIEGVEYNTSTTTIVHYESESSDFPSVPACSGPTLETARAALVVAIKAHLGV